MSLHNGNGPTVFVLDSSVLMSDPGAINALAPGNIVVIPGVVLEELNQNKGRTDLAGFNTREVLRILSEYFSDSSPFVGSGWASVSLSAVSGVIVIDSNTEHQRPPLSLQKNNDACIIGTAAWYCKNQTKKSISSDRKKNGTARLPEYSSVCLLSNDRVMGLLAKSCGVPVDNYITARIINSPDDIYTGYHALTLNCTQSEFLRLKDAGFFSFSDVQPYFSCEVPHFFPNACCEFFLNNHSDGSLLAIFKSNGCCRSNLNGRFVSVEHCFRSSHHRKNNAHKKTRSSDPQHLLSVSRNNRQSFALALLYDPTISLVVLSGPAGTGKTFLSLSVACYTTFIEELYSLISVYRPNIEIGNSMGYLPGTSGEKFAPWKVPVHDNLAVIFNDPVYRATDLVEASSSRGKKSGLTDHFSSRTLIAARESEGSLIIEPISFLRGRNIPDAWLILDEGQNLTPEEVKTVITRAASGTKVVIVGDTTQVDNRFCTSHSNGLLHVNQKMGGQPCFASIALCDSERSDLAGLASRLL
ncbi:MAG: putative ATPase related to phosphate starvation-inducible protein PhoH [Candidatus Parcubacteria bacterium]|jgi:PhoH-like ATPase